MRSNSKIATVLATLAVPAALLVGCGGASHQASEPTEMVEDTTISDLATKVAQFAPAVLTADISGLPESEQKALTALIEAAKLLDPIFQRQAYAGNPELAQTLAADQSEAGKLKYEYFQIMRGPWDRQDHHAPFAIDQEHFKGAGFYPEDMSSEEFAAHIKAHPESQQEFESLFTIIKRDGKGLTSERYSKAYATWLGPAAAKLREAASLTKNASLAAFLRARADAFASDDYYESDKLWMDLDGVVGATIGPYENYEDKLFSFKAAFEAFITVTDPESSAKLDRFKNYLGEMEQHLPVDDSIKTKRGRQSPIKVADVVFTSGDARKSVQTIAFNLPNDERVRAEKGAKKVLLRNSIETKFKLIMKPIALQVLSEDLHPYLSGEAFFNETLFHELSHSLGPAFTMKDGKKVEVRMALGSHYSALEECKADVMGAYNILFMIQKGEFPKDFREKLLVSYFAGLFRSVRFGVAEAHGKGAAIQINRFLADGATKVVDGRFTLDLDVLEGSITKLVRDLVELQHRGNPAEAKAMLDTLGVMSPALQTALQNVKNVPVDIRPIYPLAGETADL